MPKEQTSSPGQHAPGATRNQASILRVDTGHGQEPMQNQSLIIIQNGAALADTRVIAEHVGVQHESLYRLLIEHQATVEEAFNQVRFEIGDGLSLPQGGRTPGQKFALLTEDQATFLITLTRNTAQVIRFKAALVKAFAEAKRRLSGPELPGTYLAALKALTHEVEAKERLTLQNATLAREVEQMQPKAEFFDAAMNSKQGLLVRDAAKLLSNAVPGGIGERRLFGWLRSNGWLMQGNRPYQERVDAGFMTLTERPVLTNHGTIISVTPRITQKGLALLFRRIAGLDKAEANKVVYGEEVAA